MFQFAEGQAHILLHDLKQSVWSNMLHCGTSRYRAAHASPFQSYGTDFPSPSSMKTSWTSPLTMWRTLQAPVGHGMAVLPSCPSVTIVRCAPVANERASGTHLEGLSGGTPTPRYAYMPYRELSIRVTPTTGFQRRKVRAVPPENRPVPQESFHKTRYSTSRNPLNGPPYLRYPV